MKTNNNITDNQKNTNRMTLHEAATLDKRWNLPIQIHHPTKNISSESPIVLICGWAGVGSVDWGSIPKILAAKTNRNVVTYDARGLGNSILSSPSDSGLECLSLEVMASDALSVIDSYYEEYLGRSSSRANNDASCNLQREFCVGGVSMGGMVAQVLAHSLHADADADADVDADVDQHQTEIKIRNQRIYSISSLGLISSAPVRRSAGKESYPLREVSLPGDHFLTSFDGFHDSEERIHGTTRFFQALGDGFIAKPGRNKMRDKLVASFLSTRAGFENGLSLEWILAQKRVLLQESYGLWSTHRSQDLSNSSNTEIDCSPLHLSALNIPSIVIHGRDDRVIPVHHAKKLHSVLDGPKSHSSSENTECRKNYLQRNSELVLIEDCDHLCWITNGHDLVNVLGEFWLSK